jgi:hypothetical protein
VRVRVRAGIAHRMTWPSPSKAQRVRVRACVRVCGLHVNVYEGWGGDHRSSPGERHAGNDVRTCERKVNACTCVEDMHVVFDRGPLCMHCGGRWGTTHVEFPDVVSRVSLAKHLPPLIFL